MSAFPATRQEALTEIEMGLHPCEPNQALELDLAAAQLAITLAATDGRRAPHETWTPQTSSMDLRNRIRASKNDNFVTDEVLSSRERELLPSARIIVGLTFRAARDAVLQESGEVRVLGGSVT